jgi:hypothetical protein
LLTVFSMLYFRNKYRKLAEVKVELENAIQAEAI